MKDLYRRNKLRPRETDPIKIHNCEGCDEDKEAAFTILLNADKKAHYDRVHVTLSTIGHIRRHLGLAGKSNWRTHYADFLHPPEPVAGRPKPRKLTSIHIQFPPFLNWPLLILAVISLLPLGYLALVHGDQEKVAPAQGFSVPMYALSAGVPVHATPDVTSARLAELAKYQDVNTDPQQSTHQWTYVQLDNKSAGYVLKKHLAPGSGEAAQVDECRQHGLQRPQSGQHLAAGKTGRHVLVVVNPSSKDALIKLKDHEGNTQVFFYVRGGQAVTVPTIPEGRFQLQYALGENYSRACGRFLDAMRAYFDPRFVTFSTRAEGLDGAIMTRTLKTTTYAGSGIPNSAF
jgi:hypothetical protein